MQIFINNFSTTLSAALSDNGDQITIPSEAADILPVGGDFGSDSYVLLTLESSTQREVVRVVDRGLDPNTFVIERGVEGGGFLSWPSGAKVEARLTAQSMGTVSRKPLMTLRGGNEYAFPWWPGVVSHGITVSEAVASLRRVDYEAPHKVMLWANGAPLLSEPVTISAGDMTSDDSGHFALLISRVIPRGTVIRVTEQRDGLANFNDNFEQETVEVVLHGSVNPFAQWPAPDVDYADAYLAWMFQEQTESEPAADSSGNNRVGTYVAQTLGGTPFRFFLPGPIQTGGRAIRFEGTEEVYCGASGLNMPSGNGDSITVELLVRPIPNFPIEPDTDAELVLLHDGDGISSTEYLRIRFDGNTQEFQAIWVSGSSEYTVATEAQFSLDHYSLIHVELTRPSDSPTGEGNIAIFVNGQPGVSFNSSTSLIIDSIDGGPGIYTDLVVGALGGPFSGSGNPLANPHIASVAVFNRTLLTEELSDRASALGIVPIDALTGEGGGGGGEPPPLV